MSQQQYQVPAGSAVAIPSRDATFSSEGVAINYLCGDCNAKVPLKRGDPIRCKECGHRVLYKERTKR
jgi:DNA-directed RNA polymerase I, II, and III subunit RPABC4